METSPAIHWGLGMGEGYEILHTSQLSPTGILDYEKEQYQVPDKQAYFAAVSLTGKDILTASEILGKCFLMVGPTAWASRPIARNAALPDDFSRAFSALSR